MPRGDLAPKISLAGVGKTFVTRDREVEALQPIDLTILDHEFVALVGPSGCGKSTILNLIAGLLQPSAGVVSYHGVTVSEPNRQVGYMTQKDTLLPWRGGQHPHRIGAEVPLGAARGRGCAGGADDRTGRTDRVRAALSGRTVGWHAQARRIGAHADL
jgi:ABC-type Mn2+/Zn2+ transport system ATPase subunit